MKNNGRRLLVFVFGFFGLGGFFGKDVVDHGQGDNHDYESYLGLSKVRC